MYNNSDYKFGLFFVLFLNQFIEINYENMNMTCAYSQTNDGHCIAHHKKKMNGPNM